MVYEFTGALFRRRLACSSETAERAAVDFRRLFVARQALRYEILVEEHVGAPEASGLVDVGQRRDMLDMLAST